MSHLNSLISVIMPNYNKGLFAEVAVQSVLNQTHSNWELIFVDDQSTDESATFAERMAHTDSRIIVRCTSESNSGGAAARNLGIDLSRGAHIIFLDSDDWMATDCLSKRLAAMYSMPEMDFIAFPMGVFHVEPGDTPLISNVPKPISDLQRFLGRDQLWLISGPIWKTSFLKKLGGFDTRLISQQDADLHIRALAQTDAYKYIHEHPTVFYRQNVQSRARKESQSLHGLMQRVEMCRDHIRILREAGKLEEDEKFLIAQYLLDIAQMLRWHKNVLGSKSGADALKIWMIAHDEILISNVLYAKAMAYIQFKHKMFWNHFPKWQKKRESYFLKKLGSLIFTPSTTLCKSTL